MFKEIIIGIDGRTGGHDAVALAKQLADPGGHLTHVHVSVDASRDFGGRGSGLLTVSSASVGRGLHRIAEHHAADLLVVGSSSRGPLGRVLVGNHARAALNGAPCAVAIAPHGYAASPGTLETLGVGCNDSAEGQTALAGARELAAIHGSKIRARSIVPIAKGPVPEPGPDNSLELMLRIVMREQDRLDALDGVDGTAICGTVGEELARFGNEVDLLIVGSRGFGPFRRLVVGSTSNYLACHVHCPLLVLPRAGGREETDTRSGRRTETQAGSHA